MGSMLGGLFQMGVGVAGLAGAFDPNKPADRSLSGETAAYNANAPAVLSGAQKYTPAYNQLFGQNIMSGMLGSYTPNATGVGTPASFASDAAATDAAAAGGGAGGLLPGLVGALRGYGPAVTAAMRAANPEQASLMDALNKSIGANLQSGAALDPAMRREVEQSVRDGQTARGLGHGNADVTEEAMASGAAGNAMRQQRLGNASNLASLYSTVYPSANTLIQGMMMPALSTAQAGQNYASGPMGFGTPYSPYNQDLANTNLGLNWDYNKTLSNIRMASANQTAQGAGNVVAGAAGMMG